MNNFYPHEPAINYVQGDVNICWFSIWASDIFDIRDYVPEQAIVSRLKSFLLFKYVCYKYRIMFASIILSNNVRNKGKNQRRYKLHQWDNKENLIF